MKWCTYVRKCTAVVIVAGRVGSMWQIASGQRVRLERLSYNKLQQDAVRATTDGRSRKCPLAHCCHRKAPPAAVINSDEDDNQR